jgi:hypothetical protein
MDVTFRESVPFYGERIGLSFMSEFDTTESDEVNRQGEKNDGIPIPTVQNLRRLEAMISGSSS